MKNTLLLLSVLFCLYAQAQTTNFHDYSAVTILGDTISMSQYYGKKVMVVNTASQCGYTYQYGELQTLYTDYRQYGFEIVGFPCNDFSNQEPGNDSTINEFCTGTYHISFQMMSKVEIITGDTAPIYKWLQRADMNGVANKHVSWNFNKFLIDEAGNWVQHYTQNTSPLASAITSWILTPSVINGVEERSISKLVSRVSANPVIESMDFRASETINEKISIRLFSADGRLVGEIHNGSLSENQLIHYNTANLSNGIYFVKIVQGELQHTERVVVVR